VPERSGDLGCDRPSRLVVMLQGAQEIGVVTVVRGDRWGGDRLQEVLVETVLRAIGGAIQLTTLVQRIEGRSWLCFESTATAD
jgi:hypothetical protein